MLTRRPHVPALDDLGFPPTARLTACGPVDKKAGMYPRPPAAGPDAFQQFQASALFCERCRRAQPVRERLLLVLPDGELHEYVCGACGTSVGSRKVTNPTPAIFGR